MEELEIQDTWWLGQNWGCEVPRGVWVWIVNTLEVPRHLTSCWSCEFSFFLFLNKPSSMEWLQREHKLAYHFENTAKCPGRGDEKGSEAIFSCKGIGKLSLLWKCFFFFFFYRSSGLLLKHYQNVQQSSRVTNVSFVTFTVFGPNQPLIFNRREILCTYRAPWLNSCLCSVWFPDV